MQRACGVLEALAQKWDTGQRYHRPWYMQYISFTNRRRSACALHGQTTQVICPTSLHCVNDWGRPRMRISACRLQPRVRLCWSRSSSVWARSVGVS